MNDDIDINGGDDEPVESGESAKTQTLDDVIGKAFDEIEARGTAEADRQIGERSRDEAGRFKQAAQRDGVVTPGVAAQPIVGTPQPVADAATVQAPNTWTPAARAKFATLEPDVQAEIVKRETDMARAITSHDIDRSFGKQVKDVVTPYLPMINAEGATPETAIKSLLNTAYLLRTSSPQEKGALLANLARQYGADMSSFTGDQEQTPIDPTVQALQQKLHQLEGFISQQHSQQQTQTEQSLVRDINAFQADPAHPHFDAVGHDMAGLIKAGLAANLQEAYDKAVYMHPEVRQQVISAQQTEATRKQIEEAKHKAEQAKKTAFVNLRAKPSLPAKAKAGTIDQTLADTYDSIMSAA